MTDKRKAENLRRNAKKAVLRINRKIYKKIDELEKDEDIIRKIDDEQKSLKTKEDFNNYFQSAYELSKSEKEFEDMLNRMNKEEFEKFKDENTIKTGVCRGEAWNKTGQVAN